MEKTGRVVQAVWLQINGRMLDGFAEGKLKKAGSMVVNGS
jgi:hypothetical protein